MVLYLGLLLFSFFSNAFLIVPFINLLYKLGWRRQKQVTRDFQNKRTKIFDRLHQKKAGTPVGGGLLVIFSVVFLYMLMYPSLKKLNVYSGSAYPLTEELNVVFFTFISTHSSISFSISFFSYFSLSYLYCLIITFISKIFRCQFIA